MIEGGKLGIKVNGNGKGWCGGVEFEGLNCGWSGREEDLRLREGLCLRDLSVRVSSGIRRERVSEVTILDPFWKRNNRRG